jgi:hypothetical protein
MAAVASVHEQMHQGAGEEKQIRKVLRHVKPVLDEQEEGERNRSDIETGYARPLDPAFSGHVRLRSRKRKHASSALLLMQVNSPAG